MHPCVRQVKAGSCLWSATSGKLFQVDAMDLKKLAQTIPLPKENPLCDYQLICPDNMQELIYQSALRNYLHPCGTTIYRSNLLYTHNGEHAHWQDANCTYPESFSMLAKHAKSIDSFSRYITKNFPKTVPPGFEKEHLFHFHNLVLRVTQYEKAKLLTMMSPKAMRR